MKTKEYSGLDSRDKLIEELVKQYVEKNAPKIVCVTGGNGTGKTYVIDNVLNLLENNKKILKYKSFGENFYRYNSKSNTKELTSVSFSIGTPIFSCGFGVGWENNSDIYSHIRNMLSNILSSHVDVLLCVDNFDDADSNVKTLIMIIAKNIKKLQEEFKISIYILITNTDMEYIFHDHPELVIEYRLKKYDQTDVSMFLGNKFISPTNKDMETIAELCNGNLSLVEFLYQEELAYGNIYLDTLEKVVTKRISKLKENGRKKKLDEDELEAVIFSASLSVNKFTAQILGEVVNQENTKIYQELNLAKEEALITEEYNDYYDFSSSKIKSQIAEKTIQNRKEWLLTYYTYYTKYEQDEYYYRAYYLRKYQCQITSASFTLLMLAYSSALELRDISKAEKIKIELSNDLYFEQIFKSINNFYQALLNNMPLDKVEDYYNAIDKDELDLPLKAELTRAYFHCLYTNTNMNTDNALITLEQCKGFALNELYIDTKCTALPMNIDETLLRLRIIYDIAPCILDCLNQYDDFEMLYQKSKELSYKISNSQKSSNIGCYIQNVFNRKAFLYVNPTQCDAYYHKAKKYFRENEIWDEYCITLVCEAGTNIVLQQYEQALRCCDNVISICQEKNLKLPSEEKLYNNKIVAQFLLEEKKLTNKRSTLSASTRAIKALKQLLKSRQCETEYVILTNICSLSLYSNKDKEYLKYKKKIENLYGCQDISSIDDTNIDDFYRYYFSWFELYRNMRDENWDKAQEIYNKLNGFVPSIFKRQEVFWKQKDNAVKELIKSHKILSTYDFCNNLVNCSQRERILSYFFHRGLMLSDLQYTSYL